MCGELNLSDSTDATEFDIQAFYTVGIFIGQFK